MSEQVEGNSRLDEQNLEILQQQALYEFENWVHDSAKIDVAYTSGKLDQFIKDKLQRELNSFNRER